VIDTVNELAVAGMLNAVTTGAVVSPVGGRVMVTLSLMLLDTLPAASFAHAYSVFAPCVAKVWLVGAVALQPPAVAAGFADVSVRRYPVTPTASVAVRLVIDTVNELAVAGMLNAVTTGAVVSPVGGRVMVTLSLMLLDTLPAASFAHAYSVFAPCVAKVWLVGAVALHPPAVAAGFADVSVRRYPVTPTASVAVRLVIDTVNELAVAGMLNAVTTGAVVSPVGAGLLAALPGNVPALISVILLKVSPSESRFAIVLKLWPLFP